jgi:tRNA-dihydrouridine synthase
MTIYFYVAEHATTGMKYFGKTIKPRKCYKGSGTYWVRHLKKYGRKPVTMKYIASFEDTNEANVFALSFSFNNDIVKSSDWANLVEETGLDGGVIGTPHSEERKKRISESRKKSWTDERRTIQSAKLKGLKRSEETKKRIREASITREALKRQTSLE